MEHDRQCFQPAPWLRVSLLCILLHNSSTSDARQVLALNAERLTVFDTFWVKICQWNRRSYNLLHPQCWVIEAICWYKVICAYKVGQVSPRLTSVPFYGWITDWYHALWSADSLMPPISAKLGCSWCVEKIKERHWAMEGESMVSTTDPDGVERIQLGSNIADCQRNVQHEQSTYAEVLPITLTEQSYTMPQDTTMIKKKSESLLFYWPWSFKAKPCWFPYVNDPTAGHNPHWSQRFGPWLIINTGSNTASELRVEKQMIIGTKLAAKWCDWLLRGTGERSIWTNRSYMVAVSGWGGKGMEAAWFLDMRRKSAVTQEER